MSDDWTHVACNPRRSVVVEACAGSGKTWLLTSRLFRLLLEGAQPDQILAITFTRKAAQEMKERLFDLLRECALGTPSEVEKILHDRGASTDATAIARAQGLAGLVLTNSRGVTIDTFHGWFASLCQMAPLSSGFSRQSEPTDQTGFWMDAAIQKLIQFVLGNASYAAFLPPMDYLTRVFDRSALHQLFKVALNNRVVCSLWLENDGPAHLQDLFGLDQNKEWPSAALSRDHFVRDWQQVAVWLGRGTAKQQSEAVSVESTLTAVAAGQQSLSDAFNVLKGLCLTQKNEIKKAFVKASKSQSSHPDYVASAYTQLFEGVVQATLDALAKAQDQKDLQATQALAQLLTPLFEVYSKIKAEQGLCDFDDLEATSLRLLMDDEQRAYMLQKLDSRVKHLLVDEFQDTNPVQWNILKFWLEEYGTDDKPSVFLVGDPKQSIYRFRRAEARLFNHARDWLVQHFNAQCLTSDQTRRCAPSIVNAVNQVFTQGSKKGNTAFRPHESLAHAEGVLTGLRVYPLSQKEDLVNESTHWVNQTQAWLSSGAIQSLGQVMVLIRAHRSAGKLISALREADLPFVLKDKGERYQSIIWSDTLALFTFLENPFDSMALLQLLRSPLIGISNEALGRLMAHRVHHPEHALWDTLREVPEWQARYVMLSQWLGLARVLPLFETVSAVVRDTKAAQAYLDTAPPRLRVMMAEHWDWLKAWSLGVNKGRFPNLKDAILEAQRLQEYGGSDGDGKEAQKNALRIMTVHSAKGLEAEHVILFDADSSPQGGGSSLGLLIDWGLCERLPNAVTVCEKASAQSMGRASTLAAEQQAFIDEEDHLLYVALTRARQSVHVSGTPGKGSKAGWYQRLLPYADSIEAQWPYMTAGESGREEQGQLALPLKAEALPAFWLRPQFPVLHPLEQCVGQAVPRLHGAELRMGTAWHGTLEFIDEQPDLSFAQWWANRQLDCEGLLAVLDPHELVQVEQAAQRIYDSEPLAPMLRHAQLAYNELEWVLENGRLLRADRVVAQADHFVVLDYKWSVNDGNLAAYREQVLTYVGLVELTLSNKNTQGSTQAALIDRHGDIHWLTMV